MHCLGSIGTQLIAWLTNCLNPGFVCWSILLDRQLHLLASLMELQRERGKPNYIFIGEWWHRKKFPFNDKILQKNQIFCFSSS